MCLKKVDVYTSNKNFKTSGYYFFSLPIVILPTGFGSNIVEVTVLSTDLKWIAPNEKELYL